MLRIFNPELFIDEIKIKRAYKKRFCLETSLVYFKINDDVQHGDDHEKGA